MCKRSFLSVLIMWMGVCPLVTASVSDPPRLLQEKCELQFSDVTINNTPCRFVIDTGSTATTLSIEKARLLKISEEDSVAFANLTGTVKCVTYSNIRVGFQANEQSLNSCCGADLSSISNMLGQQVDGLLGIDVLRNWRISITSGELAVSRGTNLPAEHALEVPLRRTDTGCPTISVRFPIVGSEQFLIDTGSNWELGLSQAMYNELEDHDLVCEALSTKYGQAGGSVEIKTCILKEISIGNVVFRNIPCVIGNVNLIGISLLRHLNVILDMPTSLAYFLPPPRAVVDEFPLNASGIAFAFVENDVLAVMAVRKMSAGESVGVKTGDLITEVDGRRSRDMSIQDVLKALSRNGKTVSLVVQRSTEVIRIDLPLRRSFEYPPKWPEPRAEIEEFERFLMEEEKRQDR